MGNAKKDVSEQEEKKPGVGQVVRAYSSSFTHRYLTYLKARNRLPGPSREFDPGPYH